MLSKTRTVVLAVTLSAAPMAPIFAIGYHADLDVFRLTFAAHGFSNRRVH